MLCILLILGFCSHANFEEVQLLCLLFDKTKMERACDKGMSGTINIFCIFKNILADSYCGGQNVLALPPIFEFYPAERF